MEKNKQDHFDSCSGFQYLETWQYLGKTLRQIISMF